MLFCLTHALISPSTSINLLPFLSTSTELERNQFFLSLRSTPLSVTLTGTPSFPYQYSPFLPRVPPLNIIVRLCIATSPPLSFKFTSLSDTGMGVILAAKEACSTAVVSRQYLPSSVFIVIRTSFRATLFLLSQSSVYTSRLSYCVVSGTVTSSSTVSPVNTCPS